MKDLTAYFGSPSKESYISAKEVSDSNKNEDKKNVQSETAGEGSLNTTNNKDLKPVVKRKKKTKKSKMRKPSDPAVKNITELMTNNLSIISPNTSMVEVKSIDSNNCVGAKVKPCNKSNIEGISETKSSDESEHGINVRIKVSRDELTKMVSGTEGSDNSSNVIEIQTNASNKLTLIEIPSPNGCAMFETLVVETTGDKNSKEIIDCESSSSLDITSDSADKTKVVDAFQFLMDSRFKTIGSNSQGKVVDEEVSKDNESKEKLSVRKHLLSDWAEKKGASKRKREEEEKEAIISYKLEKRAKRLKKLLKGESENDVVVKTRKRRIKRISTDTDSSNDATIQRENIVDLIHKNGKQVIRTDAGYENKKNLLEIEDSTKTTKSDSLQDNNQPTKSPTLSYCDCGFGKKHNKVISLADNNKIENKEIFSNSTTLKKVTLNRKLGKQGDIEPQNKNSEKIDELLDESAQDIEICIPEPKERRTSLFNFFGVINKSDKIKNVNKNSVEIDSNDVNVDEEEQVKNSSKKVNLDMAEMKPDAKCVDVDQSTVSSDVPVEELISTGHHSFETEDTSTCDHVLQDTSQTRKRNKSKKKKKSKEKKTPKVQKMDESSQEVDFTPRRLRSWRMKIRMNLDEKTDEKSFDRTTKIDESSCDVSLSSGSDFEAEIKNMKRLKKPIKVAPVFVKAIPKPKIDPDVLEARKQFLMSGIPDSLKKCMEKQQRVYDVFPTISHVQQKCDSNFWDLPESNLELIEYSPIKHNEFNFTHYLPITKTKKLNIKIETDKITELKSIVNKIRTENPNYPVLKAFRQISERKDNLNDNTQEPKSKARDKTKKKSKGLDRSVEIVDPEQVEVDVLAQAMWTEKYKPRNSEDIIGNTDAIKSLKKWLEAWLNFSEEIINSKSKRRNSNSSDDFIVSDCSSRDTLRLPGNTVVLEGPCGSGKSTAVYAICNELEFNVIEINASSKRTGKHLLQKLQEATQSHQVRKKESSTFSNFLQQTDSQEAGDKQMCVLLVEDIDIVFEQDDNFITALMQLVTTSKRPIILTTTDFDSVFVQRFLGDFERISFKPLSAHSLAIWLQLVCLVEGMFVDQDEIGSLLEFNKGDARRTMLELQFWVQSGGEIVKNDMPIKIECRRRSANEKLVDNAVKDEKRKTRNAEKIVIHKNCMRSFEIFDGSYDFSVPYHLKLGLFWWNLPSILSIPDFSKIRINRLKGESEVSEVESPCDKKCSPEDRQKLTELSKVYESVCISDVLFRKMNIADDLEPIVKNAKYDVKDSIELGSKINDEVLDLDFVHEMTHYFVNAQIQRFKRVNGGEASLNVAVPEKNEIRWRAKHYMCENLFKEAVPCSTSLDRKAVATDYMPTMRCISRSENERAAHNTKRGNRFRNYLRNLVKHSNDSTFKVACNILRE
nr:unnamed protein product [Callosobruchus analis]